MKKVNTNNATNAKNIISQKRVLFIEANLDGTIGGSHYCLLELVKYLNQSKYKPFVLFYQENILIPEFKNICPIIILDKTKGLIIKNSFPNLFPLAAKTKLLLYLLLLSQRTYNFFRYYLIDFFEILYFLAKHKIDLVHINNAPKFTDWLIAVKILRIKCISHLRGNWEPKYIQKKLVKYYDTIISISESVSKHISKKGIPVNNFITIHDGIDIKALFELIHDEPEKIKKELGVSNNGFFIGVVGNIKPWKGQHVAIEAVRILKEKHPHIKCIMVGEVSNSEEDRIYFAHLKDLVANNKLSHNIIFAGFRKNIPEILSVLDVLVHTSVSPEPLGRVVLEGMVFSKPVIATAHGGPLEIIEDSFSGFLVKPNDSHALSQKIDYLISRSDIANNIGKQARKRVEEHFNIERNVQRIEQLYDTF